MLILFDLEVSVFVVDYDFLNFFNDFFFILIVILFFGVLLVMYFRKCFICIVMLCIVLGIVCLILLNEGFFWVSRYILRYFVLEVIRLVWV